MIRGLAIASLALVALACGKDERRPPERDSRPPRAASLVDVESAPREDVGASTSVAASSTSADVADPASGPDASATGPSDASGALDAVAGGGADAVADDDATAAVTREVCASACQNALRVTLGELAADTSAAMRAEIERALKDDCPAQCLARGSLASVTCVAQARTALELAACPR